MAQDPEKFWMVQGQGPASYRHASQASAEYEAQRLARCHPGQMFFVMEAIAAHRKIEVERIALRDEYHDQDQPF